jgi:hypothetical protein
MPDKSFDRRVPGGARSERLDGDQRQRDADLYGFRWANQLFFARQCRS